MADQAMQRLEDQYLNKVRLRIREIRDRFVYTDSVTVSDTAVAETMEHISVAEARKLTYAPVQDGFSWGKPWSTAWFRLRFTVPKAFRGQVVSLDFKTEGECIIFLKGKPVQALDKGRTEYTLLDRAKGGERVELFIEAGANSNFGRFATRTMSMPRISVFNEVVWEAYWDLATLFECVETLPRESTRRARLGYELNRAVDMFNYRQSGRDELRAVAAKVRRVLKPLLDCRANASAQTIAAMGHAHIDVAWLWPLAETVRKCGRTFSNVLELMERYPEFVFVQSQPQLYEFTKRRFPGLYRRIKDRVRKGQWIPAGCMWVEADCNVTGGESLVRQILFGTRFFRREFDHEVSCLWLPDVFGYSAAMPQILRKSGIPYFLTQKLSWSQFTRFPYHSFTWEGIDGSTVLTHFPPADTYNSDLSAKQMRCAAERYREKGRCGIQVVPYGYGDGGGGPNKGMLERLRRFRDLEEMPKVTPMAPADFFAKLDESAGELPRWVGELYLELHRGTYTTQAAVKRNNRKAELMLRETEALAVLNTVRGDRYDRKRIDEAWKTVLLNQFHDIIPGSSIRKVYEDSARQFAEVFESVEGVLEAALTRYARRIDTRGDGSAVVLFNSLSWEREDLAAARVKGLRRGRRYEAAVNGEIVPAQIGEDGLVRFRASVPSVGHAVAHVRPSKLKGVTVAASTREMSNAHIRVRFDKLGRVASLYDRDNGRETIDPGGVANRFLLFEDKPNNWDAWDIDIFYNEKLLEADGTLVSAEVVEQGPVRSVVRFVRRISKSIVTQDVILAAEARRVEFATTVEWGDERQVLLKVAFPVNVRSDRARYEIQYGNVERPTHLNRPDDLARFEVPAQKWVDMSEDDYGVALLNDCKYGHDTRDNVIRLTLLRAPKTPDGTTADAGETHRFTYALYPHEGSYTNGVVRQAYELNVPVSAVVAKGKGGELPPVASSFSLSADNVVVDCIKKAEDDDGVIVRMYEAHGCRGRCTLTTTLPVGTCHETDLMERVLRELKIRNGKVRLTFGPFEIKTIKLATGVVEVEKWEGKKM